MVIGSSNALRKAIHLFAMEEREAKFMKAKLDRSGCIGCGMCEKICPSVFRMADDGIAEAYVEDVPAGEDDNAVEAMNSCPVSVITVE